MYSYEDRIKAVELYINPGNRHLPGHFPQYGSPLYPVGRDRTSILAKAFA